jgi:hypothetical protein
MTQRILPSGRVIKNWELELERKKSWRERNQKRILEYNKEYNSREDVIKARGFDQYRRGALLRNIDFSLTRKEFEQHKNKNCQYCGDALDRIRLDRVDNSKGYTKENIVPCCFQCNRMKHTESVEGFIDKCRQIILNYSPQESRQS